MARNDVNLPALISTLRRDNPRLHQALMELHRRTSSTGDNSLVEQIVEEIEDSNNIGITNVGFTTAALVAASGETASFNMAGALAAHLMTITADFKCFVILYASQDALEADELLRPDLPPTADPVPGAGVLGEFRFELEGDIIEVSPPVLLYGLDGAAPSPILWYRIFNEDPGTQNISVAMRILTLV